MLKECDQDNRIHRLHFYSGIRPHPHRKEYPRYDTKQYDGEALILEIWGMWSASSLLLLPVALWAGVVVHVRILFMVQIELLNYLQYLKTFNNANKTFRLDSNTCNHLIVCYQISSGTFKNYYR